MVNCRACLEPQHCSCLCSICEQARRLMSNRVDKGKVAQMQESLRGEFEAMLNVHTDRIAQLEEQINVLQQTIRQLGDGLAEAAGVNEELKQELNAERLEVIGAIARKEAAMRESAAKEEVIINQLHNLGELRRELDALKAEVR